MIWILVAHSAEVAAYRAGLAEPAGWVEVGRKQVSDVGEILIRHKVVIDQDCLEASTFAALPADKFLDAASDIPRQPSWSSWDVPVSVKLSPGAATFDYYQVLDNPSPIADRYWFLRATVLEEGGVRVFRWDQVDPATWPAALSDVETRFPGAVPTRVNVGDWTFTPEGTGTNIRYRICTDAGGNLPRWVGEIAARTTLPTNVADIIKEVRRRVGN